MKILPDPEVRDEIRFVFAKSLSYGKRLFAMIVLILLGLVTQYFLSYWAGLAVLFVATALGMIRGYSAAPIAAGNERWERVTPDEFEKVRRKQRELEKWDADALDITSGRGCGCFLGAALALGLAGFVAYASYSLLVAAVILDAAVLALPHWLIGSRTYLRKDALIIKLGLLEKMLALLAGSSDLQVSPMLATVATKEGGRMPSDARIMVKFLEAPEWFLGLQVQVSINNVQGTMFPYLYCVLVAKPEGGIHQRHLKPAHAAPPKRGLFASLVSAPVIIVEKSSSGGMDVVVMRQQTTRQSGYHTNEFAAGAVLLTAIATARRALGLGGKES